MNNKIINFFKLKQYIDNNSIEFFKAALEHNAKSQPLIKAELVKWTFYYDYWKYLKENNLIFSFKVIAEDKIKISGDLIQSPFNSPNNNKVVFILHGITNTRYWIFKQAYVFLQAGYNVVWYDARNHGQSDPSPTTFGNKESKDLQKVINYIYRVYPKYKSYYLYGFSLGAITLILWGRHINNYKANEKVKLLICDSAYARLTSNYQEKITSKSYLPSNFIASYFQKQAQKIIGDDNLANLNPIKYLSYFKIPILFIHGKNDTFISYINSQELFQEKIKNESTIKSELYLIENSNHGQSFLMGDNGAEIYNNFEQKVNGKISDLVLKFINDNS